MPRIILKAGSPEYADETDPASKPGCDMSGCTAEGLYRAPKHRGLDAYYRFCETHVREYNKAWNFFEGMAQSEVEEHIIKSQYGDNPTWRYGVGGEDPESILRRKIYETYGHTGPEHESGGTHREEQHHRYVGIDRNSPAFEALTVMGLTPPVDIDTLKVRYKDLAKQYHPDLNRGCRESEERLKQINMAYTILKAAYEDFEVLPDA